MHLELSVLLFRGLILSDLDKSFHTKSLTSVEKIFSSSYQFYLVLFTILALSFSFHFLSFSSYVPFSLFLFRLLFPPPFLFLFFLLYFLFLIFSYVSFHFFCSFIPCSKAKRKQNPFWRFSYLLVSKVSYELTGRIKKERKKTVSTCGRKKKKKSLRAEIGMSLWARKATGWTLARPRRTPQFPRRRHSNLSPLDIVRLFKRGKTLKKVMRKCHEARVRTGVLKKETRM